MNDYLQIMIESLKKKSSLLDDLIRKNNEQAECIKKKDFETMDWDDFNLLITEKEIIIERINELDDGFQSLYDRVKEQLENDKEAFANEIRTIQELIKIVTDKGVQVRTGEEKNRQAIEKILMGRKNVIRRSRSSLKVAQSYVQTMQGRAADEIPTVDRKK